MRTLRSTRRLLTWATLAWLVVLGGCTSPHTSRPLPTWQSPELLYLKEQPYDRLYVEVDVVEGVDANRVPVEALREFLQKHCRKPGGVEVHRDKPIPLAEAKGKRPFILALMNMNGPPPGRPTPAYLYLLVYDSRRMGVSGSPPHVRVLYPCAVYADMGCEPRILKHYLAAFLKHELGHILGLTKNPEHGDGAHCAAAGCLMCAKLGVPMRTWLFGQKPRRPEPVLCPHCLRDLEASRRKPPDDRMSFRGAALVRKEEGYYVAKLPFAMRLGFEPVDEFDGWAFLRDAQAKAQEHWHEVQQVGGLYFVFHDKPEALRGRQEALRHAANDPDPSVARLAAHLLKETGKPTTTAPTRAGD